MEDFDEIKFYDDADCVTVNYIVPKQSIYVIELCGIILF